MRLPNCEKASVDIRKLRDYSLSPKHEVGSHKAIVFRAALGITMDAEWLRGLLLTIACEADAAPGEPSPFGEKYVIDSEITHQGRNAIVRTAWIVENGTDFPRLVSCYVK